MTPGIDYRMIGRSGGGQVFQGPIEIPGGEYALNGTDPEGALFGLVGPRKS